MNAATATMVERLGTHTSRRSPRGGKSLTDGVARNLQSVLARQRPDAIDGRGSDCHQAP